MAHTTHRDLIEAALFVMLDGKPRTASTLSRVIREQHGLPHRCERMNDVMHAALAEGVVKLAPRAKGCRSATWTIGDQPLPDWLFVRERPEPEPEPVAEPPADVVAALSSIIGCLRQIGARLDAIDARLDDFAADTSSRPLFARRNGH